MSILIYIVLIPFASALLLSLIYLSSPKTERYSLYSKIGVAAPAISALLSFVVGIEMLSQESGVIFHATLIEWINIGEFKIDIAFMADRLTTVMIFFITLIGTLIHVYAAGYMRGDEGFGKFFAYFNLFMGSMLLLVLASNPIMMFIGWELVGLSSYLLIGFYHKDAQNITAANKAFILNRVGDFGFIMGLSLLFVSLEGNAYSFEAIEANITMIDSATLSIIGMLLFIGAMGKSAQIPLYVWLPDAMAGPTPVSALIHAATMVTAGVYMVARFDFLYIQIPDIGEIIAIIGALSALFAAIIASFQSDIKKILAYSTMSQLGYMFVAVGLGAYSSGVFHVFTHAFFKALLFMGAGAVIIAMHHEQNIFKMGNLKKDMRLVYITMFIATLAISGIPPFAGFFSKDAILATAFSSEHYLIWGVGTLTALLTSFYMFRMLFTVFHSFENKNNSLHVVPTSMTWPLIVLAVGSSTVGLLGANEAYGGANWFASFLALDDTFYHISHRSEYLLGFLNVLMGIAGMWIAYICFSEEPVEPEANRFYKRIIINKFYIDEIYESIIVKPIVRLSEFIDKVIDIKVFDFIVNSLVFGYRRGGYHFAKLQNGRVQYYALYILAGVAVMSLSMLSVLRGV